MKKNQKIIALALVFISFVLSASGVCAEEGGTNKSQWSGSLTVDFASQYVGFGNGAVFYDKSMFQSCLAAEHISGFHMDLWWGTGLNDNFGGSGWDDEVDWNVGYANSITIGGHEFKYDLGVGYWDVYDTFFKNARNDIIHPYIEIGYPITVSSNLSLTPFIGWDGYFLPFGSDYEPGTITSFGSKYCLKLSKNFSLTGLTCLNYDDGGFGYERGLIWKDYLDLEWSLSERLTWKVVTSQFYVPIGIHDRDNEVVVGTGVVWKF